jgi:hypothetical protein
MACRAPLWGVDGGRSCDARRGRWRRGHYGDDPEECAVGPGKEKSEDKKSRSGCAPSEIP